MKGVTNLREANEQRRDYAARRDVIYAGRLLFSENADEQTTAICYARVAHPDWSWRQIGESLGISKDAAVSLFRRRCQLAGLR